jgi:DNA-binding MarR family transcriptional regulator
MSRRKAARPEALVVMQALWTQAHALEARSKWMQRNVGVTGPQRLLLRYVGENPGSSPADAARWLRLNPGTVSRLVVALEGSKMLCRTPDSAGGRRQILALTEEGARVNQDRRGTVEEAVRKALQAAPPDEAIAAVRFSGRLAYELQPRPAKPSRR